MERQNPEEFYSNGSPLVSIRFALQMQMAFYVDILVNEKKIHVLKDIHSPMFF